jgi:hypothetical protein
MIQDIAEAVDVRLPALCGLRSISIDLAVLLDVAVERTLTIQKAKHDVLKTYVELICR